MPFRDDLLNPIAGANPAGENLRYAPLYEKIREARREDDDAPQGEWRRERKLADWPLTIKLTGEALATKSKDLQIAAWLTEAALRRDGIAGLTEGLNLLRGLIENFWDNLYPEIEDGDAEFRATPLQWVGDRLEAAVKRAPLTRNGLDWYQYKTSRTIGYESDAEQDPGKLTARQEAIAAGRPTAEQFDEAFASTPKAWYEQSRETFEGAVESLQSLEAACETRFGEFTPSFGKLREALEEAGHTVRILLEKKRETEPDEATEATAPEPEPDSDAPVSDTGAGETAVRPASLRSLSAEPADREDAVGRVVAVARYLRREDPYSPAPFLMLRGLRWGEVRAGGTSIDPSILEPPPTQVRQQLKRLALEANWAELLEAAETAMGMPCGRGWLDLQRYACRACAEQGGYFDAIAAAIKSGLRALLADHPQLAAMTMMDDTATANAETQAWLNEIGRGAVEAVPAASLMDDSDPVESAGVGAPPDVWDLAMEAARGGRTQEAFELMSREIGRERSGRGRFHRKVQLAELCLSMGREAIAYPILNDLASEIELRKLDEWEAADALAHPLTLLFRCLARLDRDPEQKQRLYERICRLDPVQALACST